MKKQSNYLYFISIIYALLFQVACDQKSPEKGQFGGESLAGTNLLAGMSGGSQAGMEAGMEAGMGTQAGTQAAGIRWHTSGYT